MVDLDFQKRWVHVVDEEGKPRANTRFGWAAGGWTNGNTFFETDRKGAALLRLPVGEYVLFLKDDARDGAELLFRWQTGDEPLRLVL